MKVKEISMIALFPAMLAATAGMSIPLGSLPSLTFQTIFVFIAALVLGPKKGAISIIVYILIGAMGVPVFAGFRGGIGILTSISGGFIIGFIFSVIYVGFMKNVNFLINADLSLFVTLVIGSIIIYVSGGAYIAFLIDSNLFTVLAGFSVYIIGDLLKIIVVMYVYKRIRPYITYEQ
ncbi:MAG: biotin transporter BioY [Candidatus Izemoplasma sp.]